MFGIVAMATSLVALLELASAFSFDITLIQSRDASREEYSMALLQKRDGVEVGRAALILLDPRA